MEKIKVKSSWYIPEDVLKAMQVVKDSKGIQKSHQIEMGMKLYLREHEAILLEAGIDVWK